MPLTTPEHILLTIMLAHKSMPLWPPRAAPVCFPGSAPIEDSGHGRVQKGRWRDHPSTRGHGRYHPRHVEEISTEDLRKEILEKVINQVIPKNLNDRIVYHVLNRLSLLCMNCCV